MENAPSFFDCHELAADTGDGPGWYSWDLTDDARFNAAVMGKLKIRRESDKCRLRMQPEVRHTNLQDMIHGAVTLSLIDISLFSAMHMLGNQNADFAVTLELSTQFISGGKPDRPLDAVTEIVRETGRLMFLRGEVVQEDHIVAAFSALIRKASKPKSAP